MFEFYSKLSLIGKVIFWLGILVIFCSIFTQCVVCEYIPFRIQMNTFGTSIDTTNNINNVDKKKKKVEEVKKEVKDKINKSEIKNKVEKAKEKINQVGKELKAVNSFTNTLYDYFEDQE
jgi:peptidoglycan hydrolase CwlO-like protein